MELLSAMIRVVLTKLNAAKDCTILNKVN